MHRIAMLTVLLAFGTAGFAVAQHEGHGKPTTKDDKIKNALSAAPRDLAANAAVMDWDNTLLRPGTNGYTCFPTPPNLPGNAPMCLDGQWANWADAWMNKKAPSLSGVGIGYMLMGDAGASNTDPFATEAKPDNDWVEAGPHLMVIVPDPKQLDTFSTDYTQGTPWVMWKGTPYAHIMVPVGRNPMH